MGSDQSVYEREKEGEEEQDPLYFSGAIKG